MGSIFHQRVNMRCPFTIRRVQVSSCLTGIPVYLLQTALPGSQPECMFRIFQHNQRVGIIPTRVVGNMERLKFILRFIQLRNGRVSPISNSPYLIFTINQHAGHQSISIFKLITLQIMFGYIIFEDSLTYGWKPQITISVFSNMIHIGFNAISFGSQKFKRLEVLCFIIININSVPCSYPNPICSIV